MRVPSTVTARVCAAGGWLAAASALLVAAALILQDQVERAQDRAYWTVAGRPCTPTTAAGVAQLSRKLDQTFTFEGRRFWRISGAASCSGLTTTGPQALHYDVCQFNSPRAVAVRAGRQTVFYELGGGPATVKVGPGGEVTCVLNARFDGQ
ncbi:MAG TPA: hypothetical protein VGM25_07040 [Caulobacteraceae bacterium]|jgi:hypothetical protein